MKDGALRDLAVCAGILVEWTGAAGEARTVAPDTLRILLTALDLPCRTSGDIRESASRLDWQRGDMPALTVGEVGQPIKLGDTDFPASAEFGYHRVERHGREVTLAIAPRRCFSIADIAAEGRLWGAAAQIYGLRRDGDGGIGDFGGIIELARGIAPAGADAVALSPIHALRGARPDRFAPYSPSSRLFLNPLHADPALVLGADGVRQIKAVRAVGGSLIDWPARAAAKLALFRALYDAMPPVGPLVDDLARFRSDGGDGLMRHAEFEAREMKTEASFQIFLQWLAARSLAAAQTAARESGMRIGLIADLAVGVDPAGSDAMSHRSDMLTGLSVGAPPDLFNPLGQNWGLTGLSPRAMAATGYAPFIDVLRASMAHAGGIRLDHAMGLRRLWLIPQGASPSEGAYLTYPFEILLKLIALESVRNKAIVIAEDLGTVPPGFSERLNQAGILGMRILWFERDSERFVRPREWRRDATAMTSTHDLPTVAGWWRGADIATRARLGLYGKDRDGSAARVERRIERMQFWRAVTAAGVARGPQPASRDSNKVVDAAIKFVARAPSRLALFPLEDLVGEKDQPNLPGTTIEHPNWRRRQKAGTAKLLAAPAVAARLRMLKRERGRA